jgi:hypothetical protein
MATEYLDAGAKTFAASAWSGSGLAAANDFIVDVAFGPVTAGLDQSGIVGGIESFYLKPPANGIIGGTAGSFLIDADNSADAYVANYGQVTLYLAAGGDNTLINEFSCGPKSINFLTGGIFGELVLDGGSTNVNESVEISGAVYINAGRHTIEFNGTQATVVQVNGGSLTLKRMPAQLTINGGTVVFDPDDTETFTSTALQMNGGRMIWKAGAIPTAYLDGGIVDFSQNRRAFTPGATAGATSAACRIIKHPDVTLTNIVPRGASKIEPGEGFIPTP